MTQGRDFTRFARLVQQIDPDDVLHSVQPLTGGVSATVDVLDVVRADGNHVRFVARQHGERDRARNPNIARDEFRLLQVAFERGIPVPKPVLVDDSGEVFSIPIVVVAFVEGQPEFAPTNLDGSLDQMASQLAHIHRLSMSELSFLPKLSLDLPSEPAQLDENLGEGRIRAALRRATPMVQHNPAVVLHGDYWPGNLLWRDGSLVAIIDWEDASLGDPLADLGNTRLELLWAFGVDAMHAFTDRYCRVNTINLTNVPYWDLRAALKPCGALATWGLPPDDQARMIDLHTQFVDEAIALLG